MRTFLILLFSFFAFNQLQAQFTYRNPVIAGDFPDPSVIRVGDTYYAAGTSSEWAQPFRLYESKDLINWKLLGGLFKEMPEWTMGSYWAPELYYDNGTFFVYYTARRKSDRKSFIGVATTRDIRKGFTDHGLIVEWTNEAIDAFVIKDNGKRYITWKAYGLDQGKTIEILGSELSSDGLKLIGKPFTLLVADREGWEAGGMEGQCLVRRGDYIYMFYAGNNCCGRNCNYQTGVARAKSIEGAWEKYSGNPILYGDDRWRCPGHGTLVETPGHRCFFMYHAYEAAVNVYLGRQGMLDEIIWDKATGWPAFRYGKTPSLQAEIPASDIKQQPVCDFIGDFRTTQLQKEWIWDVSKPQPEVTFSERKMQLQGDETSIGSFLGMQVKKGNYTFTVTVPRQENVSRGICIYGTRDNSFGFSVVDNVMELWQVKQGQRLVLATQSIESFPLKLCLKAQFGQYCRLGFIKENKFQAVGQSIHLSELPQWDRPAIVGIQVCGNIKGIFENIELSYGD